MPLTKEQIQKHLVDPWTCPFCGKSGEDVFEPVSPPEGWTWEDLDGMELMQRVRCQKCGKSWRNYYKLSDIEEEDADGCAISNEEGG
jgi:hypothetical protein